MHPRGVYSSTSIDYSLESRFARLSTHESRRPRLQVLGISRNLSVALSYLTLPDQPRIFWIDAICINQNDRDEKSREVGRMGEIYSRARRVVVWLGEGQHDTSLAIGMLRAIGNGMMPRGDGNFTVRPGSEADHLQTEMSDPKDARAKILNWIAIRSFFTRPWFTRLWVFQEIGSATDAIFVLGTQHIQWDVLRQAFIWIQTESAISPSRSTTIRILDRRTLDLASPSFDRSYEVPGELTSNLVELINWTKFLSCDNPRDRIYAIRSLLEPGEASNIIPNYNKSPEEIYKEATLNTIEYTSKVIILEISDFAEHEKGLELPSWVPDLSIPNTIGFITGWAAAGFSKVEHYYEKTRDALILRGRHVCVIDQVATPIPLSAPLEEILAICHTWEPVDAWNTKYVAGGSLGEAFVKTLFFASAPNKQLIADEPDSFTTAALLAAYVPLVKDGKVRKEHDIYIKDLEMFLPGRTFFTTREGYIGLCSASASPGDQICVTLGSNCPLLIRPAPLKPGCYHVGGAVFVYDLMNAEGILGKLPHGWAWQWTKLSDQGDHIKVFLDPYNRPTQLDPRLGSIPLPQPWTVTYGGSNPSERGPREIDRDGTLRLQWFEDTYTGEQGGSDPRITSSNLRRIGVELEDIVIV